MSTRVEASPRLFCSVPEAAKMLGVSRSFAYDLVKSEQREPGSGIRSVTMRGRILVPIRSLEELAEQAAGGDR